MAITGIACIIVRTFSVHPPGKCTYDSYGLDEPNGVIHTVSLVLVRSYIATEEVLTMGEVQRRWYALKRGGAYGLL